MDLPTGLRGRALALALTGLVLAASWLAVAAPLLAWHAERAERLEQRRLLASRMETVAASLPQLRRQAEGLPNDAGPGALLKGNSDAIAGAALQVLLDRMAARAGLALSSAESLPAVAAGAYRRVSIRLSANGTWPALIGLLQSVEQASPRMIVDDLQIQPAATTTAGAHPMSAVFTVIAFRAGGRA